MRYVTISGFLIVLNGFFIENVGHTLTKNYNGTYWPLIRFFDPSHLTLIAFRIA